MQVDLVTQRHGITSMRFVFDVGSDLMIIPTYVAHREGIAYRRLHASVLTSSVGGRVSCYYDFVTIQSSLSGRQHQWPCAFAEGMQAPLVVGRAGFLDDFAPWIKDGHFFVGCRASLSRTVAHFFESILNRSDGNLDAWEPI
jgi:hypothetical protein